MIRNIWIFLESLFHFRLYTGNEPVYRTIIEKNWLFLNRSNQKLKLPIIHDIFSFNISVNKMSFQNFTLWFLFMLTIRWYCISDAFVIFGLIVKVKGLKMENSKVAVLTWPKKITYKLSILVIEITKWNLRTNSPIYFWLFQWENWFSASNLILETMPQWTGNIRSYLGSP